MWRRYGDRRLLERHWDAMERYMDHLARHNPDLLWTARRGNDYGDWLSVGAHTPRDVLATAYWAYDAALMAEIAERARTSRSARSTTRACGPAIVAAFNRAYVGEDAYIEGDTQTVYLLALHMDLLPEELRARAAERLVENIERHGGHLTTGFVGVGLLCPALSEAGHSDVAHRLLRNDTFPSWGYSIQHGATTIWERWDGWTEDSGFQTPMMNSFNHYSLGSVGAVAVRVRGGHPRRRAGLRARAHRPRARGAGLGARDLPVRARPDHERLAAGRTTGSSSRSRSRPTSPRPSTCRAARPSRWAPAAHVFTASRPPDGAGAVVRPRPRSGLTDAGPARAGRDAAARDRRGHARVGGGDDRRRSRTRFGVSPMTARRDLAELERRGVVRRTHGGAVLPDRLGATRTRSRAGSRSPRRRSAGWRTPPSPPWPRTRPCSSTARPRATSSRARMVETGMTATVLTNSLPVMELVFHEGPELELVCVGGTLRRLARSFVGPPPCGPWRRTTPIAC